MHFVKVLNLDSQSKTGRKGKWLHNMIPGWEYYMLQLHHAGVVLRSQSYESEERRHDDKDRCLPWPSVTSCALLAVCVCVCP